MTTSESAPAPLATVAPDLAARLTPEEREAVERAALEFALALWRGKEGR